ncbi:MAG: hypothetical protein KY453_00465 [Gemmatimonadetes bacterium]|nr:hypothetical protein [Gemmatimonadota bacterium]
MTPLTPLTAPRGGEPAVCPHCWMVNPGPFRLCARCGASMETFLQESGGLRRTAPLQSPMPVAAGRLSRVQRAVVGLFVALLALGYLLHLLPSTRPTVAPHRAAPTQGR